MAEFTEIMRQARRLCAAYDGMCAQGNCPLDTGETCGLFPDHDGEDYNELERIIMDWAAEHSPVYPSWEEGWRMLFPDAKFVPCPGCFGHQYCVAECASVTCSECKGRPLPAEVAKKLGIKPIIAKE